MKRAELVFVIEASGSMYPFIKDVKKCYYSILDKYEQKYDECYVTTFIFNDKVKRIVNHMNIKDVPFLPYCPDGGSVLFDAIGEAIDQIIDEERCSKDKADNISIVIISNGVDDNSKMHTAENINFLIYYYAKYYNWRFILSSTDAFFFRSKGVVSI